MITTPSRRVSAQERTFLMFWLVWTISKTGVQRKDQILNRVQELADHLIDCFFLPSQLPSPGQALQLLAFPSKVRASSAKTSRPTPNLSPQPRFDDDILVATTQRLSSFRGVHLEHGRYRCSVQSCAYSMRQKEFGVLEWLVLTPWVMMEACSNMRKPNTLEPRI